jgi:hypothetical protein
MANVRRCDNWHSRVLLNLLVNRSEGGTSLSAITGLYSCLAGGSQMDSKVYLEWRAKLGKWVVEYRGQVQAQFDTKAQGEQWMRTNFPNHGKERERVQKRTNSPHGVKVGEWM